MHVLHRGLGSLLLPTYQFSGVRQQTARKARVPVDSAPFRAPGVHRKDARDSFVTTRPEATDMTLPEAPPVFKTPEREARYREAYDAVLREWPTAGQGRCGVSRQAPSRQRADFSVARRVLLHGEFCAALLRNDRSARDR